MRDPGLTRLQIELLDLLVTHGSVPAVVAHLGTEHRHVTCTCNRICERLNMPLLHVIIAWAEHRGIKTPRLPPPHPFQLTDAERRAWEMRMYGSTYDQIAEAIHCHRGTAYELVKRAGAKIPGEREGQKQAAWRRACTPGT